MKKQHLQNEQLDRIGSELLRAASLRDEETETIVSAPDLFGSVKIRIEAGQSHKATGFFTGWLNYAAWNWRTAVLSSAGLAILAIGAFGLISFANRYYLSLDVAQEMQQQVTPVDVSQLPAVVTASFEPTENPAGEAREVVHRSNAKKNRSVKARPVERQSRPEVEEVGEFYALTYTGDLETEEDGQIVRVELPRSSLFAMGVDVSMENETERIKADLLIGSDGVTKAVRLVD